MLTASVSIRIWSRQSYDAPLPIVKKTFPKRFLTFLPFIRHLIFAEKFFVPYFVYILYSPAFDKFYVGQTDHVLNRLKRHNAGYEKATFPFRPWNLSWYGKKGNRKDALCLEKKLKNLSKQKLLRFIEKYSYENSFPEQDIGNNLQRGFEKGSKDEKLGLGRDFTSKI